MMTGYWLHRGFFSTYFAGKMIGRYPTPEQAQAAIDKAAGK